jgi:hypothetical protein
MKGAIMPRRPIESIEELRASLAAVPPEYRARVAAFGRLVVSALEGTEPAQAAPTQPAGVGSGASAGVPPVAAPAAPQPPPLSPTFDRIIATLRGELDRRGIEMPEIRRRARIPIVPLRPRPVGSGNQ